MADFTYSIDSINELIQNANITKYELAQRIKVSPSHFYNVLNKKLPLSEKMAKKIISVLTAKKQEDDVYKVEIKRANIIIGLQRLAEENSMTINEVLDLLSNQFFPVQNSTQQGLLVPKEVLAQYQEPTADA